MLIALCSLACCAAPDSNTQSQITPPAAGSAAASGAAAPAADSGGRSAAAMLPAASTNTMPTEAGAAGVSGAAHMAGAGAMAMTSAAPAAGGAGMPSGAGAPAAMGGAGGENAMVSAAFSLTPVGFPMAGAELTFPLTANPPTNESPEFTWTGVPVEARSLALAFRDLGNNAVKWIIWDMPPSLMHIPPNLTPVAMPSEVPGSSQLGSLDNQGYAGPGSGARQYDFTLWALDTNELPVRPRMTTVQIHELLEMHEVAKTPPVLVRNTRNL